MTYHAKVSTLCGVQLDGSSLENTAVLRLKLRRTFVPASDVSTLGRVSKDPSQV